MPTVFLSHSHENKAFVDRLATDLRKRRMLVWVFTTELGPGDSLPEEISKAIKESDSFVVVDSRESRKSKPVEVEVELAKHQEIIAKKPRLIPVCYENPTSNKNGNDTSNPAPSNTWYADFRIKDNYDEQLLKLVAAIRKFNRNWRRKAACIAVVCAVVGVVRLYDGRRLFDGGRVSETLGQIGQVAGIGGSVFVAVFSLFRDALAWILHGIAKLTTHGTLKAVRSLIILGWLMTAAGVLSWAYGGGVNTIGMYSFTPGKWETYLNDADDWLDEKDPADLVKRYKKTNSLTKNYENAEQLIYIRALIGQSHCRQLMGENPLGQTGVIANYDDARKKAETLVLKMNAERNDKEKDAREQMAYANLGLGKIYGREAAKTHGEVDISHVTKSQESFNKAEEIFCELSDKRAKPGDCDKKRAEPGECANDRWCDSSERGVALVRLARAMFYLNLSFVGEQADRSSGSTSGQPPLTPEQCVAKAKEQLVLLLDESISGIESRLGNLNNLLKKRDQAYILYCRGNLSHHFARFAQRDEKKLELLREATQWFQAAITMLDEKNPLLAIQWRVGLLNLFLDISDCTNNAEIVEENLRTKGPVGLPPLETVKYWCAIGRYQLDCKKDRQTAIADLEKASAVCNIHKDFKGHPEYSLVLEYLAEAGVADAK